jgi:virulence factor Mce-like protein
VRRLAALGVIVLALGALAVITLGPGAAQGSSGYRVDAIFDTAKGIVPGQLVKIAGARVGTVQSVVVTPQYKARIEMKVDDRFAPFRSDASCSIKPEGLIGENFVQCLPGTPSGTVLQQSGGNAPTVPLSRTSVPVDLTDLFNIWNTPTSLRLSVLLNELGAGFAARGDDLSQILQRANPTLGKVRQVLGILNTQRSQLNAAVASTDTVIGQLAPRSANVQALIVHAAGVSSETAAHHQSLALAVQRLPGLLTATGPALLRLNQLTENAAPLLADLHTAAPSVNALTADVGPFAAAGLPALRALAPTLQHGRKTVHDALPVVELLDTFASSARPTGAKLDQTLVSLRDTGFVEGLLRFVYLATAGTARYDAVSHILPANLLLNSCSIYATTPQAGCSANYTNTATASAASRAERRHASRRAAAPGGTPAVQAPTAPTVPTPGQPATPTPTGAPTPSTNPAPGPVPAITGTLNKVIPAVGQLLHTLLPGLPAPGGSSSNQQNGTGALLNLLLK